MTESPGGAASRRLRAARWIAVAMTLLALRATAIAEVTDDWDGDPRPIGGGFDIGADERRQGAGGDLRPKTTK